MIKMKVVHKNASRSCIYQFKNSFLWFYGEIYEEELAFFIYLKFICSYGMEISQGAMVKNLQDNGQRTRRCLRDLEVCRLQTGLGLAECMLPASKNLAEISGISTGLTDVLNNLESISDSYW
jgi:hypothetical protein